MNARIIQGMPTGKCRVTLQLRKQGEFIARGEIIENENGRKHFYTKNSPVKSFSPETVVLKYRKEAQQWKQKKGLSQLWMWIA